MGMTHLKTLTYVLINKIMHLYNFTFYSKCSLWQTWEPRIFPGV